MKKAQSYMNSTYEGYYLQLDIKGFFYNINKDILFDKLAFIDEPNLFSTPSKAKISIDTLNLAKQIIYHDSTKNYTFKGNKSKLALLPAHKTLFKIPKNIGLPIGNLTSQFFANVYMNEFDNFVKRRLKVKRYIRFVDDFVLFDNSKVKLEQLHTQIRNYLRDNLSLELRADTKLKKHHNGLDFLGYIIRPNYILTRRRVANNYKYKKAQYLDEYEKQKGKMNLGEIKAFLSIQASFASHIKHANSFKLLNKVGEINETNPFDFDRS